MGLSDFWAGAPEAPADGHGLLTELEQYVEAFEQRVKARSDRVSQGLGELNAEKDKLDTARSRVDSLRGGGSGRSR